MAHHWFIERNGHTWGPFSVEHLREFLASGQLRPEEMLLPDAGRNRIAAREIAGLVLPPPNGAAQLHAVPHDPTAPPSTPCASLPSASRRRLWLAAGGLALVLAAITGGAIWVNSRSEPPLEFPNLPEWFQPAHRTRKAFYPIPEGSVEVEGLGYVRPDEIPPPGNFTEEWLEKNFTHYLERNAFYYAYPRIVFQADGKLLAGRKVILGEQVNDAVSLICIRTRDGRLVNMFVETARGLRERSKGPPRIDDD